MSNVANIVVSLGEKTYVTKNSNSGYRERKFLFSNPCFSYFNDHHTYVWNIGLNVTKKKKRSLCEWETNEQNESFSYAEATSCRM